MNADEAKEELKVLQDGGDGERNHVRADEILCELLTTLDCADVVEEYNKIGKWYA